MKARKKKSDSPDRLYLAVPREALFDVLDDGLAPTRLYKTGKAARKTWKGRSTAVLTVLAWEAKAEGISFGRDEDGWISNAPIPHHLLGCTDRAAMKKLRVNRRSSCGGVIISGLDSPRVLLLFKEKPGFTAWKLPKGGIEPGETRRAAAKREVGEESGIKRVRVLRKVGRIQYFKHGKKNRRREKAVDFFLMVSKDGECDISPRKGESFVACAWLPFDEAIERITQPEARGTLARARALVQNLTK